MLDALVLLPKCVLLCCGCQGFDLQDPVSGAAAFFVQMYDSRCFLQVVVRLKSAKMGASVEAMDATEAARLGGCCVVQ